LIVNLCTKATELKFCHTDVDERRVFFVKQLLFDKIWQKFRIVFEY